MLRRIVRVIAVLAAVVIAALLLCDLRVTLVGGRIHEASALPTREVGLVLGTSPRVVDGRRNLHFEGRMDLAAKLFLEGKVKRLLVSGDNGTRGYDEPTAMKRALIDRGVPEDALTLDYAGFRTLDSVARAKSAFGIESLTIITDDFHLPRAIYLARAHGIDAIGCGADTGGFLRSSLRVREHLARVLAVADVLTDREPKFVK